MSKKTVVLDFDGVINLYKTKGVGPIRMPDPPVPGIKDAIAEIRKKYRVVVLSARCNAKGGMEAIQGWLDKHGIVVDGVVNHKPIASVYVDDRAIRFDGKAESLLSEIETFVPWHEQVSVRGELALWKE